MPEITEHLMTLLVVLRAVLASCNYFVFCLGFYGAGASKEEIDHEIDRCIYVPAGFSH